MPSPLDNPFRKPLPESTDPKADLKVTREIAGAETAEVLRGLQKGRKKKSTVVRDERLNAKEQGVVAAHEAQKMTPEKLKAMWVDWALELGKDEKWLEKIRLSFTMITRSRLPEMLIFVMKYHLFISRPVSYLSKAVSDWTNLPLQKVSCYLQSSLAASRWMALFLPKA